MKLVEYVVNSSIVAKQVGDELILVPVVNEVAKMTEVFTLNEVGAFIWDLLCKPCNEQQIIDEVMQVFDVDKTIAEKDVNLFLNQTLAKNIIKLA